MQVIWSILGFVIAIGILVTVHEFGHFWVARRFGIKVLRFSIGFGKPLYSWLDKRGTEYIIASIPLGGYVEMLDETEKKVPANEVHRAYNRKSVWVRMAVICAGPLFNILFAILAYWLVFINGTVSLVPILGTVPNGSIADLAGLQQGQEIIAIEDKKTSTWQQISLALLPYLGEKGFIKFTVKEPENKSINTYTLDLNSWAVANKEGELLQSLGLDQYDPTPPIIGEILPNLPASKAGLVAGDIITAVNGIKISNRDELINYVRPRANQSISLQIQRGKLNGEILTINIMPTAKLIEGGEEIGFIGVKFLPQPLPKEFIRTTKYGIGEAFAASLVKTKKYISLSLQFLYKMVVGKVSLQHVAGPISIAKYAGQTAAFGLSYFLSFLALISINLGILNMLPIPILDGGNLMFCLFEALMGRPPSDKALMVSRFTGVVLLSSLMLLALVNDLFRL